MEIREYLKILQRRKWVAILTTLVTVTVVGLGSYLQQPIYSAAATVRVAQASSGSVDYVDSMYAERLMSTYVEIAKSRSLLEEVIERLALPILPGDLAEQIKFEVLANTELLRITVADRNPARAKAIADALAALLVEQSRTTQQGRQFSVTMVAPAVQPDTPTGPRTKLNIALGTLVGLAGGIGLAFLFENLDPTLHSADDLEAAAGVPVWGCIPNFAIPRKSRHGTIPLDGDGQAPASEAFRILRTNVLSSASGTPPQTILIASAEPGAGKSTVLANLAAAMAQAGRKVVVVDSDLRHPCLHQVFDLPNEMGLSSIIHNSSGVDTVLQATKIQGVSVLTSGPLAPDPAELLGSSKMKDLVQELAQESDIVLFDAPPLLAVADTAVLATMVDGVLLVAARDQATGKRVQRTLQQLGRIGARVLGIVFNKAKAGDGDYLLWGGSGRSGELPPEQMHQIAKCGTTATTRQKGVLPMTETRRPQRLTAQKKFKLYLETRAPDAPIGEIIRRHGIHLDDLRHIEQVVESSAVAGLEADGSKRRLPNLVTPEYVAQLEAELAEKTAALAELSVSYTLLGKKERQAANGHLLVANSHRKTGR